jgi:hypothetical protein
MEIKKMERKEMERKKIGTPLKKSVDELSLAIPIPTNQKSRLHIQKTAYLHKYDPQTEADMTDRHKQLRKILDYFEDKVSTDTIFGDSALRVFENVDRLLYNIWWTKIEVTMEEVFSILDGLKYGHDTILLLAIVSPSSYRILYKNTEDEIKPQFPTFTLEGGMIGGPLDRRPDLNIRRATFYQEATGVTRNHRTTMFNAFTAAQIQANFHGGCISISMKSIRRVFWKLEASTPDANRLAMDYQVLALMKDAPSPKTRICMKNKEVAYDYETKAWYTVEKPAPEPQSKSRKVKVPLSKKREDSRKRMEKFRANKLAGRNSFRTINSLNSSVEFYREMRSRSSSIRKQPQAKPIKVATPLTRSQCSVSPGKKRQNQDTDHSIKSPHSHRPAESIKLRSSAKKCR